MRSKLYVMCAGALFAIVQFSYYVEMEWLLSSAWTTYAAVIAAWLVGAATGLQCAVEGARAETLALALNLAAFYGLRLGLYFRPFDNRLLPFYALMIAVSGAHAGSFLRGNFRRMKAARELLLHENNGFIIGLLVSFFGFFLQGGDFFSLLAPGVCALLLLGIGLAGRWRLREAPKGLLGLSRS